MGIWWSATNSTALHALSVAESAAEAQENSYRQGSNLTPLKSFHQTLTK